MDQTQKILSRFADELGKRDVRIVLLELELEDLRAALAQQNEQKVPHAKRAK